MGTLVCPLCCNEKFSNQLSLRYHLLSVTDNVYCPECNHRFDSILQLADHLNGMCGKEEFASNSEEYTSRDDIVEEERMVIHEGQTPEAEGTELSSSENMNSDFHEEVMHQMISVAAGPQLCDSEAVYLVSSIDVQQAGVTLIKKENVDATEQKLHVAADDEGSRGVTEQGYCNVSYEAMVEKSGDAGEKPSDFETDETTILDGHECDKAVHSLSSAGEGMSGSMESQHVLSETEDPGDGQMVCGEYACSSCGITFNSVMEHIRMYHGGEEVVIEVPQAKKIALEKLIRSSKEVLGAHDEQMIDMEVSPQPGDINETAELEETIGATNFMSGFPEIQEQMSDIHPEYQMNALNCAAVNSGRRESSKQHSWVKERTRVVADEEKIKRIVPGPKRAIPPTHIPEEHVTGELKYISKEVKIGRFWETKSDEKSNSENGSKSNNIKVPILPLPGGLKVESKKPFFKKDTRTSIEKLFSGNFLLKGPGGRGTRPGPYLGVNRVPEVKVIRSPGDEGTENAISVFTCSTCQQEFGNVSAFERHSCTIAKMCTLVCKLCDEDIIDMKEMRVHMESVHNIRSEIPSMTKRKYNMQMLPAPVKCESCDMTFTTIRALKLHRKVHERAELKVPLECPVCHNICSSHRTLKQHMKVHTKPLPVKKIEDGGGAKEENVSVKADKDEAPSLLACKACSKSFSNNDDLREHWQEHLIKKEIEEEEEAEEEQEEKLVEQTDDGLLEGVVPEEEGVQTRKNTVQCVRCHKEIDKSCEQEHMAKHFSPLRYECPVCNKSFSKHGHLNTHLQIHRGFKNYSCIHCGKIFANTNLLRTHIQSHMAQRPYQCGFCGRGFFRPHDKVEHERIHTGEKPYQCSVCGMRFRVRYCLTLHMRRHTGVRPYSCKVCGKTFRTGTAFKAHTKIHLDERAYKCPVCPKKFNTLIQLSGHKNSHTKPYSCVECNRPFSSLYAVRKHMESHEEGSSGKAPLKFQCDVCGASYARRFALRDHLKVHGHNIPSAATEKNCSDDSSSDVS